MNSFHYRVGCINFCAVLAAFVLLLSLPVRADLYSWTDADGVKHFSNEAPPKGQAADRHEEVKHSDVQYQQQEEQRKTRQGQMLEESRSGDAPSQDETAPVGAGAVVMYATPHCKYCALARAFFAKHGIAYKEYDISSDKKARARFKELNGTGVPLIFIGDKRIPGYREALLKQLLGIK